MRVVTLSRKPDNVLNLLRWLRLKDNPNIGVVVVTDGPKEQWVCLPPDVYQVEGITPFVFARNANKGIEAAGGDVILCNDDTELLTEGGFTRLSQSPKNAITVPRIDGPGDWTKGKEPPFVCVFIPKQVQDAVGLLDERFTKYGYEDNDYCRRVYLAGLTIHKEHGCLVKHNHPSCSTFHGPNNFYTGDNMVAFDRKWGIKREYVWPEHLEQVKENQ